MKYILEISAGYLDRESARMLQYNGLSLKQWIKSYCKKNKIKLNTDDDLTLGFKSENQLNCFTRRGNGIFPYFEFL